jgi:Regulator of chromosome condensation (RCC1) repeat
MMSRLLLVSAVIPFVVACGAAEPAPTASESAAIDAAPTIVVSRWHYCVLRDNQVSCGGQGIVGQLGSGPVYDATTPLVVPLTGGRVASVAVSSGHTCALDVDGSVTCWGQNAWGEVGSDSAPPGTCAFPVTDGGSGEITCQPHPTRVADVSDATALALGEYRSCVVTAEGEVECWGLHMRGTEWLSEASGVESIAIGDQSACALLRGGSLGCSPGLPINVQQWTDVKAISVSQDTESACVIRAGGRVDCGGENYAGQRGIGNTDPMIPLPDDPPAIAANATQVAVGEAHVCALMADGSVQCWGRNGYGEIGVGIADVERCSAGPCQLLPRPVSGLPRAIAIAAGGASSCAVTDSHDIYCWGQIVNNTTPTLLRGPWSE